MTRETAKQAFLKRIGWAEAAQKPLAGDASNRRYDRLNLMGTPAVLMDAPPEKGEDTRPFTAMARYLTSIGLSAPEILGEDAENGFLLLEDLGDALFARVTAADPKAEEPLYHAAVDALLHLHAQTPPDLAPYDAETMAPLGTLALDWYAAGLQGMAPAATPADHPLHTELHRLLTATQPAAPVLVQRDFHAENLLWLPERAGVARVGLLDFQDARLGHPAYDLVSLLYDARRDVSPAVQNSAMARYIQGASLDAESFQTAAATQSAQRNLRILGVFARLSLRDNKAHYVDLIPRVWRNLMADLSHPALAPLRKIALEHLPEPTAERLATLKGGA
ncbi:phosphotransferase [Alphaproteobacteria bacterium KMM 3653]|uniref:Phosphotransferase n=1 Tax=Harenicola maris TaxID=2841044 RepID=A0AAP2G3Y2_9RHOB|nr:phosphotransferase [Harenicola maris]